MFSRLLKSLKKENEKGDQRAPINETSNGNSNNSNDPVLLVPNKSLKSLFRNKTKINLLSIVQELHSIQKFSNLEIELLSNFAKTNLSEEIMINDKLSSFKINNCIQYINGLLMMLINNSSNNLLIDPSTNVLIFNNDVFELMKLINYLIFIDQCHQYNNFDIIKLICIDDREGGNKIIDLEFDKLFCKMNNIKVVNDEILHKINMMNNQLQLLINSLFSVMNKSSVINLLISTINIVRIIVNQSDIVYQFVLLLLPVLVFNNLFGGVKLNSNNEISIIHHELAQIIQFTTLDVKIIQSFIEKTMKGMHNPPQKSIENQSNDSDNANNELQHEFDGNFHSIDQQALIENEFTNDETRSNLKNEENSKTNDKLSMEIVDMSKLIVNNNSNIKSEPVIFVHDQFDNTSTELNEAAIAGIVNEFIINSNNNNNNNQNELSQDDYEIDETEEWSDEEQFNDEIEQGENQNDQSLISNDRFEMISMFNEEDEKKKIKNELKNLHKGHNLTNPHCSDTLRMKFTDETKTKLVPCDYEFSQMDNIMLMRMKVKFKREIDELMVKHGLTEDEFDVIMLSNLKFKLNSPFKTIKVDIMSLIDFARSFEGVNNLIDLMCDQMILLLIFEFNDPQLRIIENSFNEIDTCICIDGVQRPFINIRDFNSAISTCLSMTQKSILIENKGERYSIIDGIDLNTIFKGQPKKVDQDPSKQSLQSLFNRCIRIVSDQKINNLKVSDGFTDPEVIYDKILKKSNDMFDRTGHFQFKEIECYKPLLSTLQLANLITLLLMLDESIHEIDSMLRLLRTVNTIESARNKRFKQTYFEDKFVLLNNTELEDDDEIDDFIDVSKHKNDEMFVDINGNVMSQEGPTMVKSNELREKLWNTEIDDERLLDLLLQYRKNEHFRYSKVYGNVKVTIAAIKKHKTSTERKFHFLIEMIDSEGKIQIGKVHLINMEKLNNDIKNFRTLLHLRCLIDVRSVTYKMFDLYCRHPNQNKADMICSIEFARKHREGQLFCWKLLSEKFRSMELIPHNSTDLEMVYWCFISALDECVHDQFAFSLFHAPNRQSPKEMISCYDAVLRETPLKDRINSSLLLEFIQDIKMNIDDYFDSSKLKNVLNEPDTIDVNMFLSTASSTNLCLPNDYDSTAIHLLTGHVVKDFKFKVFDEALENSISNMTLQQIMEMCTEVTPVCSLTSKMNVKSVREIYVFDPITSIAASAESHIAQKISDCSYSDVIMKETKKGEIISNFIENALERINQHQSANIVIIEGDGKKFNQHMVLECFNEMYKSINDAINENLNSEWFKYMNFFYSYYQRKQIVVKMKSYVECFCFELIKKVFYGNEQINALLPAFKHVLKICSKVFERSSEFRIASQTIENSNFETIANKISNNYLSKHEIELWNNCHDGTKQKLGYKLNFNKAVNKLMTQYEQLMNSEYLSKYINMLMSMCYDNIINKLKRELNVENSGEVLNLIRSMDFNLTSEVSIKLSTITIEIVKMLKQSDLIIPTPFGMAQGILACSSSVYSSSVLKFTCKKLKEIGWFDTFECVATSDDLLIIATTSKEMNIDMQKQLKIAYGTMMSELGIPMNAIKTSVKVNPNRLSFNSVLYDCCNNKKSDYLVTTNKKLPCITRILKNIYSTPIDDHCVIYNQISTGLKELFSTIRFSLKERVKLIDNGRSIYSRTEYVDYYHQGSSSFEREFFQAWPSSKETINSNSDYALFNRKEMDLLWYMRNAYYWNKLNLTSSLNMSLVTNVKGEKFENCELSIEQLNSNDFQICDDSNQIIIMELSTKKIISINLSTVHLVCTGDDYVLKTRERNLEWFSIKLNKNELNDYLRSNSNKQWIKTQIEDMIDIDSFQAILNNVDITMINNIKESLIDSDDAAKIYYSFIKWYGNNLEVTSDPLGYRIKLKHFDKNIKLLDVVSKIDEMKTCNVQNIMNLFSHLGENYREQLPHNLILKVQGTPHIPQNVYKYNYTFNNCEPIVDGHWVIPMTLLTSSLMCLNPFVGFNYAFAVDDTSTSSIYDINPNLQLKSIENDWKWKSELLGACIMMDYDQLYYRSEARQLLNGSIVPFIPDLTFNGCYGLPKIGENLITFLNRCKTRFDPWIICQRRRSNQVYTDHGLLDDVVSNRLYYLNHHKIVWCCDRRTLLPKSIEMCNVPACIKHYEVDIVRDVKEFIDGYTFDNEGKWRHFNKKCKSGKSRSLPMFNLTHYSNMFEMSEEERKLCFKYNKKNIRTDETPSDKIRKLWVLN